MKPVCPRDNCHRREPCEPSEHCDYEGSDDLDEREIIKALERWREEGRKSRDDGTVCPYPANTLAYYMHGCGWLRRDLQLALCRSNPAYRQSQFACGQVKESDL